MPEARGSAEAASSAVPVVLPALVLDDLPDGVLVIAGDGSITDLNPAAERLLGRPRTELVGIPLRRALPLQDTSGRRWWDVLREAGRWPAGVDADGHPNGCCCCPAAPSCS